MSKNSNDGDGVGYGKAPKHSRFVKGRSGNPKGRKKGSKNLSTDLQGELSEKILVKEGGKSRKISKQKAMVKALVAKALQGNVNAFKALMELRARILPPDKPDANSAPVSNEDRAILDAFIETIRKGHK